jgi:hypothetical protein
LNANNSIQLINSIINGKNVQKNNKYGKPIQILISDIKYALKTTAAAECNTIAKNKKRNIQNIFVKYLTEKNGIMSKNR